MWRRLTVFCAGSFTAAACLAATGTPSGHHVLVRGAELRLFSTTLDGERLASPEDDLCRDGIGLVGAGLARSCSFDLASYRLFDFEDAADGGPAEDRESLPHHPSADLEPVRTLEQPGLGKRLPRDFKALLMRPATLDRRGWFHLGTGMALVGAVSLLDDEIRSAVRSTSTEGRQQTARRIRPLGQEASFTVLGGAWLAGEATGNERFRSVARDGLEASLFASGLVVPLTKVITGRGRPRDGYGSGRFGSSHESFPSGEVTQAFAVASVVAAHSDKKWVKVMSWGLASSVAWQRMELDAHWASDVTAGALLGAAMGRWVVRRHRPEKVDRRADWSLAPHVGDRSAGVAIRWSSEP